MVWRTLQVKCVVCAISVLTALAVLTSTASATPTCSTTWMGGHDTDPTNQPNDWADAGNWTDGVPGAGSAVCVETGTAIIYTGTMLPSSFASVDVGSSGAGALDVSIAEVVNSSATTIGGTGTLDLDGSYHGANAGNASLGGGPVTNLGTIVMQGTGYAATLFGTIVNHGTITVPDGTVALCNGGNGGAGSLDNQGVINVAAASSDPSNPAAVDAIGCAVTDDTGGSIANQGSFSVYGTGASYVQGNGSETGNAIDMGQGSSLTYTGTGPSSVNVPTSIPMTGNLAAGQQLSLAIGTTVTEPSSFTSAGTITLDGTYHGSGGGAAGMTVSTGTFTNTGTLIAITDAALSGTVVNAGTVVIEPGGFLELLSGTFANAASGTLAPQISSSGYGDLQVDGGTTFTAGGTLTPQLEGGFTPTAGQEFNVVAVKGGSYSGTFGAVTGGFHADSTNPGYIGAVYGPAPAPVATTPTTSTPTPAPQVPASTVAPTVSALSGGAGVITAKLKCATGAKSCKSYTLLATVTEHLSGTRLTGLTAAARKRTKVVTVASAKGTLKPSKTTTLKLTLNRAGLALLKRYGKLKVGVVISAGGKVVKRETVTVTKPNRSRRHDEPRSDRQIRPGAA